MVMSLISAEYGIARIGPFAVFTQIGWSSSTQSPNQVKPAAVT